MLEEILKTDIFAFFMVFSRLGAALMLLPGYGEPFVSPRFRLMIGLTLSLVVTPLVAPTLPALPESPFTLFLLLSGEIIIGLFIGAVARFMLSCLQVSGMVIAYQSGMANVFVKDPATQSQGALFGAFLTIFAVLLIFVTDLHYLLIAALVDSYTLFLPGEIPNFGDISETLARVVSDSFTMAIKIAAPFLVVGLVFYLGLGLLGRLMPQIQMFFIVLPVQIMLGLLVFALAFSTGMMLFLNNFENTITGFLTLR